MAYRSVSTLLLRVLPILAAVGVWTAVPDAALAATPEGSIVDAGSATAVAGSYIVVLRGHTTRDLPGRYGGTVTHTYGAALQGYAATMSEAAARRLAADPAVAYVQQDHKVYLQGTQTNPPSWGLDRIDQPALPLNATYVYPNTAPNVHAYVLDSGIRTTHVSFGGRAVWGYNAVDAANIDCLGHGTHVAGTLGGSDYGVAKSVQLVAVKIFGCSNESTAAIVIDGINWVTAHAIKPAVANMSIGGAADSTIDTAVANSIASGITYGVGAGNGDIWGNPLNACNVSPARVSAAITVSSTDNTDTRVANANIGSCVDIFAPGAAITSAWSSGDTDTNVLTGTSMATPHVVGAAALILAAHPTYTPAQVRDALVANAITGAVIGAGSGSPNKLLYLGGGTPPANDFVVSASPTSGTVAQGSAIATTINTVTISDTAQSLTLTASGVPSGASVLFTPASIVSGGASTMTVTTGGYTYPGIYTITVTGTGTWATRSTTYTLVVTSTGSISCETTSHDDTTHINTWQCDLSDTAPSNESWSGPGLDRTVSNGTTTAIGVCRSVSYANAYSIKVTYLRNGTPASAATLFTCPDWL